MYIIPLPTARVKDVDGTPFPAWGARSLSQCREYSFYRQPPKNLLRCEIEKASPMAGLWVSTPPFSL